MNHTSSVCILLLSLTSLSCAAIAQNLPDNAYILGNNWYCNEGYQRVGSQCQRLQVPNNAYILGNNWYCNEGYQRAGDQCQRLQAPDNAYVLGNSWYCNEGYQRVGDQCRKLTQAEQEQQEILRNTVILQQSSRSRTIDGLTFSLRDIERQCEVYKYSDNYGDIECRGSEYRLVERRCEAYFPESRNGVMECSRELRSISGDCSVYMYSDNYGDLSC